MYKVKIFVDEIKCLAEVGLYMQHVGVCKSFFYVWHQEKAKVLCNRDDVTVNNDNDKKSNF